MLKFLRHICRAVALYRSLVLHITLTIAYFLPPLPLSHGTLTFGGVLANGPKVRQFAGAQELGGVRWVIGARPIIETRVVLFTDGDGAIWTTPVTNTLAREVSQVGHTFSVHATGRVTGQLFSSAERSSREERKE
jgi:hypothetical protein